MKARAMLICTKIKQFLIYYLGFILNDKEFITHNININNFYLIRAFDVKKKISWCQMAERHDLSEEFILEFALKIKRSFCYIFSNNVFDEKLIFGLAQNEIIAINPIDEWDREEAELWRAISRWGETKAFSSEFLNKFKDRIIKHISPEESRWSWRQKINFYTDDHDITLYVVYISKTEKTPLCCLTLNTGAFETNSILNTSYSLFYQEVL